MKFLRRRFRRQRGNAVLFSLIIMSSAMTISLGMTSLVVGEVRSVTLILPSEHAYYKAESYVEQALWHKKVDANYQFKPVTNSSGTVTPPVGQQLSATYLCGTPPCFLTAPTDQATLLKEFYATTAPNAADVDFPADVSRQYDIATATANGSGVLTVSNIAAHEKADQTYQGMEVSIIAYPVSSNPALQFPVEQDNPATTGTVEGATSPVFVDKVFIPAGTTSFTTNINQADRTRNPIGEPYLSLDSNNVYRLRIKALGADTEADVRVTSGAQTLDLRSPDFTVRSVAEDANSRRGIQVLTPNVEQLASIFDYVLFSDLDLNKLGAKVPPKSVVANVYRDLDGDCVRDPDDPGIPNLLMTTRAGSVDQISTTNETGTASFIGLKRDTAYTISTSLPSGYSACAPPGNDQAVSFSGDSTEVRQMTFLLRQGGAAPSPSAGPSVGPRSCTKGDSEGGGLGSEAWDDVDEACDEGGDSADVRLEPSRPLSEFLKLTDFGMSVPGNATIRGISVELRVRIRDSSGSGNNAVSDRIQLVKHGEVVGTNQVGNNTTLDYQNYTSRTFGGPTQLWGTTWSPAEINAGEFGVAYIARQVTGNPRIDVDAARITVYYTQ